MYGMVNKAVQGLITSRFGEDAWQRVKARAKVEDEIFLSNESYPDSVTYDLVAAASEELKLPAEQVLHAFGEYWILETARRGYGALLDAAGSTIPEFLQNLPSFHARVRLIFPNLQPPRFETTDVTADSLKLHYFSDRPGLAPFMVGLLSGLGKHLNTPVEVTRAVEKGDGSDHDVFFVKWTPAAS